MKTRLKAPACMIAALLLLGACASQPDAQLSGSEADLACDWRMTQSGFLPSARKTAILRTPSVDPVAVELRDADGQVVWLGQTLGGQRDAASGEIVQSVELPRDLPEGQGYRLAACGASSEPFVVDKAAYAGLSEDALTYFYHNRIGTPIEARFVQGPQWARQAALAGLRATCFAGEDTVGNDWPGCDYTRDVEGSWFDAGDFGVYAVNMGISIWTLQNTHERLALLNAVETSGWGDGRVALPETGNGVPEILDEARWGMESLLKLQVPEGASVAVPHGGHTVGPGSQAQIVRIDAAGLVHHKLAGRQWPPLPIWPWDADQERFLYPPSTSATLALAATGAQCARIWQAHDPEFAQRCRVAAERAYSAALRHPDILAATSFDGSGGYGDGRLTDEFAWAATELFLTTGEPSYLDHANRMQALGGGRDSFGWADVDLLPVLSLNLHRQALPSDLAAKARGVLLDTAARVLEVRDSQGYAFPLRATEYNWGSNSTVLNRGMLLAAAYDLTGDVRYRDAAVDGMEYVLGRNVLKRSYVSGYGPRAMRAPHHRIWAGAVNPEFPLPPPGALSGGANDKAMVDPVAERMKGKCAPMACWADDVESYALNEVAINWNAPLVALSVFLDQTERAVRTSAPSLKD